MLIENLVRVGIIEGLGSRVKDVGRKRIQSLSEKILSDPTRVDRALDYIVEIKSNDRVNTRFQELVAEGGVPIVFANHQSHADGMAIAVMSEYLRGLAARVQNNGYHLEGLATLLAVSMVSGDQSRELKWTYDLLIGAAQRKGLEPVTATREKDVREYGMNRNPMEMRPFIRKLQEGYGIAFLPEGTVQGGRHPKGTDIENIYGMQEVQNNRLIEFFELVSKVVGRTSREPFYLPLGLHGSFRVFESPEGDKPKLTDKGALSLLAGAIGIPLGLKMQAKLLMPFTEEEIVEGLGSDWMKDSRSFNTYAMKRVASGIPPIARGVYR